MLISFFPASVSQTLKGETETETEKKKQRTKTEDNAFFSVVSCSKVHKLINY